MSSAEITDHSPQEWRAAGAIPTASNVVFIDNYDSFTWNVYQYLIFEGATVSVYRNDKITLEEIIEKKPTQIIISPGPGHPTTDSGVSRDVIKHFAGKIPIFGVCMGQQCIIDIYGGKVESAGEYLHGKTSPLHHDSKGVYRGLDQGLEITRYHSLAGTHASMPECLEVTSWIKKDDGSKGIIQGVRHKQFTVEGVQFHPESILSEGGRAMIRNFLHLRTGTWEEEAELANQQGGQSSSNNDVSSSVTPAQNGSSSGGSSSKQNILQRIYANRKEAVDAQKKIPSQRPADLEATYRLNGAPPLIRLVDRLKKTPFDVSLMAEIKRASPSKGVFDLGVNAPVQARKYALAGASVISVLTEPEWFKGSIEDLRAVRQVLNHMPNRPVILRKEFIFDEYQILEGRLAGADTVLLIVKMLDDELLSRLYAYSLSLGMEPLVEVQNSDEMTRAVNLGAKVIGVNNRNLESFEVDINTTGRLRSQVPEGTLICALSGINSHDDVLKCKADGINAVLVGEAIMRAPDASEFIHQLCAGTHAPPPAEKPQKLLVKVCGTRSAEAARAAAEAGADMIGMILVPGAKRLVSDATATEISAAIRDIATYSATSAQGSIPRTVATDFFGSIIDRLPAKRPLLVGVFQNQQLDEVLAQQKAYNLDIVQFHGSEPIEWATLIPVPVMRAFKPTDVGFGVRGQHMLPLLDSGGGSGKMLGAEAVRTALQQDSELRIMLAGGLGPDNVAEALASIGDECTGRVLGVDASSGLEEGGVQSLDKIRRFVSAAKGFR